MKIIFALLAVVGVRCDEFRIHYFDDVDDGLDDFNKTIFNANLADSNLIPIHDESFRLSRNDVRKREPQFLGFDIQDDNIEVRTVFGKLSVEWFKQLH